MRVFHLYLIVLSALLPMLAASSSSSSIEARNPAAEMKQLLLADVNQATDQQEMPALRLARQLGNGRRFGGRRFGGGGRRLPFGGGGLPFGGGGLPFGGGGGGRRFGGGRRRIGGPGFSPQQFGFFG